MKYYSEETVKKIIADTVLATFHISTSTENYPFIEIADPHGRLVDIDKMIKEARESKACLSITSMEDLADLLEEYAKLDKIDNTVVLERTSEKQNRSYV